MESMKPIKPMECSDGPQWCPEELGEPTATGSQGRVQYAYCRDPGRLLLREPVQFRSSIYDTGGYQIQGISQATDIASARILTDHAPLQISQVKELERNP